MEYYSDMYSIEELYKKAMELKTKGMSDKEISTELHLSVNTVTWLLSKDFTGKKNVQDVRIGWRSIGVFGGRIASLAQIMVDVIDEEMEKMDIEPDAILGVDVNGIPYATLVSYFMNKELIIYKPHPARKDGYFSSNYAGVNGKKVVIIDDVLSTGETMRRTIKDVKAESGEPVLAVTVASKLSEEQIEGIRIRSLIRANLVGLE
ncbi:orotate phosphoribosyltransferase-like protein [Caldiplasma sukawensis]